MTRCPHCGQTHGPDNHFCGVTGQPLDLGPRLLGQVLLDRFEITSLVGEGSLAVVLRASDRAQGNRNVAVKMLHPRFARDAAATDRFLSEAKKVGEIAHPNLVPVLAVGRDPGGAPLVVREYMDGLCVARYLREHGPMPVELAGWIVAGVLRALRAVHEAGLCDGDMTADDVFLLRAPDGGAVVKVLDFGESHVKRAALAAGLLGPEVQRSWASEQVRSGVVNERSDIFAAGAILYQTLTGKAPFPDGIPPAPQVIPLPQNPSSVVPGLNRKLDILVRRAMSLLPTDRYPAAAAFLEALGQFVPAASPKIEWDANPAAPPGGFVVVSPAPAAPAAAPAAPRAAVHKMTLMGAPVAIPGAPAIAPPVIGAPAPAPGGITPTDVLPTPALGPSTARMPVGGAVAAMIGGAAAPAGVVSDDATAPTMQMPVMDGAAPPAGLPLPAPVPKAVAPAPFELEPPAAKGGKLKWIILVLGLLAAVVVTIVIFATGDDEETTSTPVAVPAAADAVAKPAADAGAAPVAADAGAAEAAAPVEEDGGAVEEVEPDVVDAGPDVEPDADEAGLGAEPDVVDEGPDVEEAEAEVEAEAEADAEAEAEAEAEAAPVDAGVAEDARPREAAARPDAGTARDAATQDAAAREARPRDTAARDAGTSTTDRSRPRDAGTQREGRTGIIRDIGL